jgi:adenosylcobinamide kinase / adenosylcobinamide-phosphate guanylyltransferase
MNIHLVTGGARSGKSTYAEWLAAELGGQDVLYIATAEPLDQEMTDRITQHASRRPCEWLTVEAFQDAATALSAHKRGCNLLDCLTLLASNVYLARASHEESLRAVLAQVDALLRTAAALPGELIVVTNEIGMGVVPATPLGRGFRDALGCANQRVATAAATVTLLVSGVPMVIKSASGRSQREVQSGGRQYHGPARDAG